MNILMVIGIVLSCIGATWAIFEKENPDYWIFLGLSWKTRSIITTLTFILWPGCYLLIIFSSNNYIGNLIILALCHFIALPFGSAILGVLLKKWIQK